MIRVRSRTANRGQCEGPVMGAGAIMNIQICPRCKQEYSEQPVLSRKDAGIKICPKCSSAEDLEAFIIYDRTGKKKDLNI